MSHDHGFGGFDSGSFSSHSHTPSFTHHETPSFTHHHQDTSSLRHQHSHAAPAHTHAHEAAPAHRHPEPAPASDHQHHKHHAAPIVAPAVPARRREEPASSRVPRDDGMDQALLQEMLLLNTMQDPSRTGPAPGPAAERLEPLQRPVAPGRRINPAPRYSQPVADDRQEETEAATRPAGRLMSTWNRVLAVSSTALVAGSALAYDVAVNPRGKVEEVVTGALLFLGAGGTLRALAGRHQARQDAAEYR